MAAPPITYRESLPQVQRTFQLFADRVEIEARWTFGGRHHSIVRLADLSPRSTHLTIRNKWFKKSVMVGAIACGIAVLVPRYPVLHPVRWLAPVAWAVAGVALVTAVRSFRKRSFVLFSRLNGRPGLDIGRTDPEAFEAFLGALRARLGKG